MGNTSWNKDFFTLPGKAVFDRDKQRVAAVTRAHGNLDLFVIGFDNKVWTTFWNEQDGWSPDWFPLPGRAVFDREKQQVAAVSRASGNLDLFVIGFDNKVWTTFWNEQGGWSPDWFPLPGRAVFDREKQQVAAVSRAPGNLDLFVIGFDNKVWSTFWNEQGGWSPDWFPLPGQAVFDRDKQKVAAVSRAPGNLDLFVIGYDNKVWTTFWNEQGSWSPDWFPLPGGAVFDREKQHVAAVSRASGNLDLFVIGFNNKVCTTYWNEQSGWSPDWFALPGGAVFDRDKQQVTAVSRAPGNLDLFVIGFNKKVCTTYWNEQSGWSPDWFALPGQAEFDRDKQQVAAVSRAANNLDLFVIGGDNRVWSTFYPLEYSFSAPIVTGGLAALGGRVNVTIYPNGALRCWGEATNSGIDGYDYTISAAVKAGSGRMLGVVRSGSVPNRVPIFGNVIRRSWDETFPPDSYVASIFDQFANAQLITNLEYKSDIGGALEAAGGWLLKWGAGTALGPVFNTAVFFGVNVGSLISTGSLVPGARILEGTLWMAGPYNTLFAIAAHGVASLGSQEREIHQDEYDWANKEVFKGSLPPREKLILTDTLGPGGRAFAFPRFDEKITLNMGPAAFADPRGYSGRYGQTFIHELVHACQIHYSTMDIRLLTDAISNRVCEITSGNTHTPYIYGPAGADFASFNMEQQAQIVSDWFGGTVEPGSNQTGIRKDENSPYYRYIHGNVWVGRYW